MKIALLGPDGQVGWELQRALAPLGEVLALRRADGADMARPEALAALLDRVQPQIIANAAAHTAVDKAEAEPELARAINADSPGKLARWAADHGAWLLHYSTDYVFDGSGSGPWREDDATGPLSTYGRSKLAGEEQIRASGCRHLILRTSWVHGARGDNFARKMLRLAEQRDALTVIDDQIGAPTGADLLADVAAHLLRQVRGEPGWSGTYHLAAAGETSWHGYARHVLAWAQAQGLPLKAGPDAVQPVPSSAFKTAATRPLNSRLDTAKLRHTFGLHLPDWQAGVDRMLRIALQRP